MGNVAPNCLPQVKAAGTNWDVTATRHIFLMKPVYDTVQLVDSVTKSAEQTAGTVVTGQGTRRSLSSCVTSSAVAAYKVGDIVGNQAVDEIAIEYDGGTDGTNSLAAGDLVFNTDGEYMLLIGVPTIAAASGTINVVRNVKPPCVTATYDTPDDNDVLYKVAPSGCYLMPAATLLELKTGNDLASGATALTVAAITDMTVGGYLFIDNEYMLITDIDGAADPYTVTVVRNVAPPCVIGTTTTTSTAHSAAISACANAACNDLFVLSLSGSDNMISTSMRAIVELSPREPIVWAPVAPALPPSAFYVDVKVGVEYSEAEFATKSAAFTRAMGALTGVAVESTTVSYSAARRASGNVNARSYVLSQAEVTALLKKLGTDTDTCTCGSTCQKALLDAVNEKLVAEGLKPATSAEIVFNDQCKPTKKKSDDNLLLILLLLLLIPIGAAVYWCCKQEPVAPVGKPMAPVSLPQPYPVLEMSPQPVMMAPMPMVEMSPQPVMMAPMPMVEMS